MLPCVAIPFGLLRIWVRIQAIALCALAHPSSLMVSLSQRRAQRRSALGKPSGRGREMSDSGVLGDLDLCDIDFADAFPETPGDLGELLAGDQTGAEDDRRSDLGESEAASAFSIAGAPTPHPTPRKLSGRSASPTSSTTRERNTGGQFTRSPSTGIVPIDALQKECVCCNFTPQTPSPLCPGQAREWHYSGYEGKWCKLCGTMARIMYPGTSLGSVEQALTTSAEAKGCARRRACAYLLCKLDPARERVTPLSVENKIELMQMMSKFAQSPLKYGVPMQHAMTPLVLVSEVSPSENPLLQGSRVASVKVGWGSRNRSLTMTKFESHGHAVVGSRSSENSGDKASHWYSSCRFG